MQKSLNSNLEAWRLLTQQTHPEMAWDDDNYITPDINAARMRAKYYGAKVIINRPSLDAALHDEWSTISLRQSQSPIPPQSHVLQQTSPSVSSQYHLAGMRQRSSYGDSPSQLEPRSVNALKPEIRCGVQACIHAAMRSTTAFDGVADRLIVTNIFGTAHA